MSDRATRQTINLGSKAVKDFMMPNGSYRMSQASAAEAVDESPVYALRFLASNDSKALLGERYTDYTPEQIEVESTSQVRGQTRINALPLEVVTAYWLYRAFRGNRKAFALCFALMSETLERRFDGAFGVSRSEADYDQRLSDRIQQLEASLGALGEAYAEPDQLREQVARLEEQLRQNGIEPWQLEGGDRDD